MIQRLILSLILIVSQAYLNAASSSAPALQWFKTVSGSGMSNVAAVAADAHGNFYIAGGTTSLDFPSVSAAQPQPGGSPLIRINPSSGAIQKIYSPVLATLQSIAVDPSNPQTLYGTSAAGLLRSTDGGSTWKALPGFPSTTNVNSVAVDPTNGNTLYAGTTTLGALKSTDGGATWIAINNGIPPTVSEIVNIYSYAQNVNTLVVSQIWIDPNSPEVLFTPTNAGLLRSADAGASWSTSSSFVIDLVFDPFTKGTIYAVGSAFSKSTDDGVTWTSLAPLPDQSQPTLIAVDPFHQGTLYGSTDSGLFVSTDSGENWTQRIKGFPTLIATDPNKAVIYANLLGLGIVASSDGFKTYSPVPTAGSPLSPLQIVQIQVVGSFLFVVGAPTTDVFVTKLDPNGNIVYSTYFGGAGSDNAAAMALANDGSVYVTGSTGSTDFPVTKGAYATSGASFVFKLNPDGSLAWSTYFANGYTAPYAIAVDAAGNPYIGGQTSGSLPVTPGVYETQFSPTNCPPGNIGPCFENASAFLTKFNAQGSLLEFSTYIFENQQKQYVQAVNALALAPNGNIYFGFNGFNNPTPSASGVYLMNAAGSALLAENISEPVAISSIALGKDGNLYATGSTGPTFRATPGAYQSVPVPNGVDSNAFVLKFDGTLSKILAATLLGGEGVDAGASVALDASGNVIVSGYTDSKAFPIRAPFQGSFSARSGFVTGLDSSLSNLLFSTYLGDTRPFIVQGAVPDGSGDLLVAGATQSSNSSYYIADPGYPFAIPSTVIVNKIALPPAPVVRVDSVVNYASRLGVPLSPSEAIEVIGSGFGSDAKLMLDGNPLPVVFANADSIVVVLPNDLQTSGSVQLTVSNNGVSSNPVNLLAAAAAPGIYTSDNSGFGQGYILNADGTRNSQSNPAVPGTPMTILATGVGQISNVGAYVVTDQPVAVFADGFYVAGIAAMMKSVPGLPGDVYEISVYAPDLAKLFGANPDNHNPVIPPEVPITLFIGSAQSQLGVMVWVKPD
jgi:uncharacterized protein (TIGR03437 family)